MDKMLEKLKEQEAVIIKEDKQHSRQQYHENKQYVTDASKS